MMNLHKYILEKSKLFKIPWMTTAAAFTGQIDPARTCFDITGSEGSWRTIKRIHNLKYTIMVQVKN